MKKYNGMALPQEAVEVLQLVVHLPTKTAFLCAQILGDGPERCTLKVSGETFTATAESLGIGACVSRVMAMRGWTDRREMRVTTAWQGETRAEFAL